MTANSCIILGIDPGSRITGYGVIKRTGNHNQYITSGCIRVGVGSFSGRLRKIFDCVQELMHEFNPTETAIEQVFVGKSTSSALKLGQARGAAIVALASCDTVAEYSARQIKQAVVGYGAADKSQVQQMVKILLNLSDIPASDAADALAVALCHSQSSQGLNKMIAESLQEVC